MLHFCNELAKTVVTDLTSAFTPTVTDFPTTSKDTGNSTPVSLLLVNFFNTEEETAAIVSSLVGGQFSFSLPKIEELRD